jgi:B12-binding domain/radical SAM domain protein
MSNGKKHKLGIRLTDSNRFTIPVILNQLESAELDHFFEVMILQNFQDVLQFVHQKPVGLLVYSFMTPHLPMIIEEVNRIRKTTNRGLKLLAGGPHTSGNPLSSLKMGFDYAYAGPVETGFIRFIQNYLEQQLPDVPAIFSAPELNDLDDSLPISSIFNISPPIEITRGCYWNCSYCQTSCQKAKHRSFSSIQLYYQHLKKRGHHLRFNFICPSAFEYGAVNPKKLNTPVIEQVLNYCKNNGTNYLEFGIFPSETRPNTFTAPLVDLIVRYCDNKKVAVGAQTGSDRLLKEIRRGHSVEDIENACSLLAEKNLQPLIDVILGFPGEINTDRYVTLKLIKKWMVKYQARIQVHYFLPLSGTPMENSLPTALDYKTIDTLEQFEKDGICTDWWKTGRELSRQLVEIRDRLNDLELDYQEENLSNSDA